MKYLFAIYVQIIFLGLLFSQTKPVQGLIKGENDSTLTSVKIISIPSQTKINADKKGEFIFEMPVRDRKLIISYNQFGAPKLNDGRKISISHSSDLIAVIISEKKAAVDIEKISNKPLKILHKFISNNDSILDNKMEATLAWSAKEAIYKLHQRGEIDFKKDIIIQKIDTIKKQIHTTFQKKNLVLNFQKINNHFLVYVCI